MSSTRCDEIQFLRPALVIHLKVFSSLTKFFAARGSVFVCCSPRATKILTPFMNRRSLVQVFRLRESCQRMYPATKATKKLTSLDIASYLSKEQSPLFLRASAICQRVLVVCRSLGESSICTLSCYVAWHPSTMQTRLFFAG